MANINTLKELVSSPFPGPAQLREDTVTQLENYQTMQDALRGNRDLLHLAQLLWCEWHGQQRGSMMERIHMRYNQIRRQKELAEIWDHALEVPRGRRRA